MFCPDCGTANVKSQKFCTRCGANILAIDRAREMLGDVAALPIVNQPPSSTILKIVALISIFGFLFITSGTVFLALIDDAKSGISIGFGVVGFMALVLICRSLLRLSSRVEPVRQVIMPSYVTPAPPPVRAVTNRRLGESSSMAYDSVTEESTRQFEAERQGPSR